MLVHDLISARIDCLLERWRGYLVGTPRPTERELAERAIADLYHFAGKARPKTFWCDNPYQMAVIPLMVHALVETEDWYSLFHRIKLLDRSDKFAWESQWQKEWKALRKLIRSLERRILPRLARVETRIRDIARVRLAEIMRELVLDGCQTTHVLLTAEEAEKEWASKRSVSCKDIYRHIFVVRLLAEKRARVNFTRTLIRAIQWDPNPGFFSASWLKSGTFTNPYDKETSHKASQIKEQCAAYERLSERLSAWLMSISVQGSPRGIFNGIWLPHFAAFLPFVLGCQFLKEDFFGELQAQIDNLAFLSHYAGGYYFCKDFCFVCPRPVTAFFGTNSLPHHDSGPAMVWQDGYEVYSWKGQILDQRTFQNKDAISCRRIKLIRNIERRRLMIDMYGEARFLQDAGAKVVSEDDYGTLYRLSLSGDEDMVMVKVQNSTAEPDGSFKHYYLRVPPHMSNAREAVAWTFGLSEQDYELVIES